MIRKKVTLAVVFICFLLTSVFSLSLNSLASGKTKVKSVSVSNVTSGKLTVVKGKKYRLDVEIYPENAKNKTLQYKSSNAKVVTVSSTGLLIAKKTGTAKVTVKSKDNSKAVKTIVVTVVKSSQFVQLKKIKSDFNELSMQTGDTETIALTFSPANVSNTNVTYTSSDEEVAVVSDLGVITAVSEGEAKITIRSCDNLKIKTTIEIKVEDSEEDSEEESSDVENGSYVDDSDDSGQQDSFITE